MPYNGATNYGTWFHFVLSSCQNLAVTGRPSVMMWCSTPCVEGGRRPSAFRTSANYVSRAASLDDRRCKGEGPCLAAGGSSGDGSASTVRSEGGEGASTVGSEGDEDCQRTVSGVGTAATTVCGNKAGHKPLATTSTSSWKCWRKSTPMMWNCTSARRKAQV